MVRSLSRPLLLLTIDVEEDMPGWTITDPVSVANIRGLERVAELCGRLRVRPTYLCTYPVVKHPDSSALIRSLHERGDCEVGTHLHPWNTPPFAPHTVRGVDEREVAYYCYEIEPDEFRAKLESLHAAITELTGAPPTSFRAGRFGIDESMMDALHDLGYEVDSSITPGVNHLLDHGEVNGPNFRGAPRVPYRPSQNDIRVRGDRGLIEIPVGIGLTRHVPERVRRAYLKAPRKMHVRGLLSKDFLRVVDMAWLYPPKFELRLMARAARTLVREGASVLNVFLHSSELVTGAASLVNDEAALDRCYDRLRGILKFCLTKLDAQPATLTEAARALSKRNAAESAGG